MKAVVQRVRRASVSVGGKTIGEIGRGLLIFLGVRKGDGEWDADYLAKKVANLRVFEDGAGKINRSIGEVGGSALVVSQFTLYGDCRKGRRPSFTDAAGPDEGRFLYERFVSELREKGIEVKTGRFGEHMIIKLENDGPVTLVLENIKQR
jgi:D-tyrosyl-tRNA(Tyr) deacylase